jgi:hypothetical protein
LDPAKFTQGKTYYEKLHFSQKKSSRVHIEKSTSYLEKPYVAERIKAWFPNATIIVLMRNPVERAISNYFFSQANGLETRSIEEAFAHNEDESSALCLGTSVSPFAYVKRGFYAQSLKEWKKHFASSQFKILLFEEVIRSKQPIQRLCSHLTEKEENQNLCFPKYPVNKRVHNRDQIVPPDILLRLKEIFYESVMELDQEWNLSAAKLWHFNK